MAAVLGIPRELVPAARGEGLVGGLESRRGHHPVGSPLRALLVAGAVQGIENFFG